MEVSKTQILQDIREHRGPFGSGIASFTAENVGSMIEFMEADTAPRIEIESMQMARGYENLRKWQSFAGKSSLIVGTLGGIFLGFGSLARNHLEQGILTNVIKVIAPICIGSVIGLIGFFTFRSLSEKNKANAHLGWKICDHMDQYFISKNGEKQ